VLLDFKKGGIYSFADVPRAGWRLGISSLVDDWRQAKIWAYFDLLAFVFPFGWLFGRAGCAIAHESPGIRAYNGCRSISPAALRYDLGLLEFLFSCR